MRLQAGQPAALADDTADVEGHRGLREGVVAGAEARGAISSEHGVREGVEQAPQVGHRRAFVDHQALDLEELEAVAGIDGLVAVAAAGRQHADGRLAVAHGADLAGRGVRAQQRPWSIARLARDRVLDVDRVPQVARGVVGAGC